MFRISQRGEGFDDAETLEATREIVRGNPPGCYDVDEIRAQPFPSGATPSVGSDDQSSGRADRG